ncbi:hypothetical protein LNKW23_42590 [Paralimibaculum aggregatum]|uniref:Uncharacterized protein n=1 Tax=Paralimibaculum aggregatum TaxID=3036245 RepID=A0ABQ6LSI6_9RHOB|nr:hypothetical protein LNKW23_42590 [Limibaculum sp. NKW23]
MRKPGRAFLAAAPTLRHFRDASHEPALPDPGPCERRVEDGAPRLGQRATARRKALLAGHRPPPLDVAAAEAPAEFVARRKAGMPDEWY